MALDAWRPRASIGMLGEIAAPYAALGAAVVPVVLASLVVALRAGGCLRGRTPALVAVTLALASIAPILHIVPITIASGVAADRYLYLPLAGVALGLAVAARGLAPRRAPIVAAAVLAGAVASAWVTRARALHYTDETLYWVEAAEHAHPRNTAARSALGGIVRDWGPTALGCRLFESVRAVQEEAGATGSARHRRARENLAACWMRVGRDREAGAILEDLLRAHPDAARVHFALMQVHLHLLEFDGAARELRLAVAQEPSLDNDASYLLRGLDDARKGAAAFADLEGRERDPLGYARFLEHVGRSSEATAFWVRVATAPSTDDEVRDEARFRLAFGAPPPVARQAFEAWREPPVHTALLHRLERRERRWDEVARHQPRIERLVPP
jgi:tetratricopeptide (TPR) repeat protein